MAFVTTHVKNPRTMLWSTSPSNRKVRGEASKKDIARLPVVKKKSKIFRGYNKTIEPSERLYNAKQHTEAKKGRYVPQFAQLREKSLMMQSLMQSSVAISDEEEEE